MAPPPVGAGELSGHGGKVEAMLGKQLPWSLNSNWLRILESD